MSDPIRALYDVSAKSGDGAAIHWFVSAETPDQAGQVLADSAKVVRMGIDPGWPVRATAVAMTHAPAGRMPDDPCPRCAHPMRAPA
jgi:hypothetical protein